MNVTRTINVKGLPHHEREELVSPSIEALQPGEQIRIVVEFDPAPLANMAKARGLAVSYERGGPREWMLRITNLKEPGCNG